jgi:hypothetical protein
VKQSISDPLTCLMMVTCAEEEMGSLPEDTWQISWPVRCGNQRISALSQEYLHNTGSTYGQDLPSLSIGLKKSFL